MGNPWGTPSIASPGANGNTTDKAPARSISWSFASRKPVVTRTRRGRDRTETDGLCLRFRWDVTVLEIVAFPVAAGGGRWRHPNDKATHAQTKPKHPLVWSKGCIRQNCLVSRLPVIVLVW